MGELVWQRIRKESRLLLKESQLWAEGGCAGHIHPPLWPHGFQWHDANLPAPCQVAQLWQQGLRPGAYLPPLQKRPWKADNVLSSGKEVATLLAT